MTDYTLIIKDSDALSFVTADNLVTQLKVENPAFPAVVGAGFEIVIE